ncbi:MAG: alpha/beta fold hydrolase [Streptosporangiales bacterium]|nr:alpha/beta fold hydrolase [Streptosporangiales bacterium]
MVSVRASSLAVNGLRAPLLEAGPAGAAEAVVFVHGNPGSSQDWLPLVAEVGTFARAVAFDQPGYGGADKPTDFDYTVDGYAAHLGGALEQLGVEHAHLVLHDFGGPWGLAWAAEHPDAFRSVVLINTGVFLGYRWHLLARIWRTPVLGELFMATTTRVAWRMILRAGNRRPLPREFVDRMYDDFDSETKRAVLRLYRATDDPAGLSTELAAELRPLDRPALVVWGRHDPYIPVAVAERQVEVFPSVETVLLDAGHWPFVTHAEDAEAAVIPFLERVTTGGA